MTDQANGPAELREALERATARADAAEAELRGLKTEVVFEKAQVPLASASLYQGDEITLEAVTQWATEHGIPIGTPTEAPKVEEAAAADAAAGLPEGGRAPAVERITQDGPTASEQRLASMSQAAGSQAATAAQAMPAKMSQADFQKMLENPATREQAERAYIEGRVQRNPANVQADQMQAKGIIR